MQRGRTAVFVCKDLAHQKDLVLIALKVAENAALLWKIQLIYARKTLGFSVLFGQGNQSVVLERRNKVFIPRSDELKVFRCREPAVHQHIAKLQAVVQAGLNHLAHKFVFGHCAHALDLTGLYIAILQWLFDQLKGHWNRCRAFMVQSIEQVMPRTLRPLT